MTSTTQTRKTSLYTATFDAEHPAGATGILVEALAFAGVTRAGMGGSGTLAAVSYRVKDDETARRIAENLWHELDAAGCKVEAGRVHTGFGSHTRTFTI